MELLGLQKMTLLDVPGMVACTVFLGGCNLRCPFCHNPALVLPEAFPEAISREEFFSFLRRRQGKLDAVCVTGGEPTIHRELPAFLRELKALGFFVKLDTNGSNPQMLRSLLAEGLVDYVAMDIKNSPERYALTCGGPRVLEEVRESARLLMECTTEYEFRTTVCAPLHTPETLAAIGSWLRGAKRYYLQPFVDSGHLVGQGISPLSKDQLEALGQAVLPYIPNTQFRGI